MTRPRLCPHDSGFDQIVWWDALHAYVGCCKSCKSTVIVPHVETVATTVAVTPPENTRTQEEGAR